MGTEGGGDPKRELSTGMLEMTWLLETEVRAGSRYDRPVVAAIHFFGQTQRIFFWKMPALPDNQLVEGRGSRISARSGCRHVGDVISSSFHSI